ncbi:hypothetical protein MKX03_021814 [Papaver bracteatum]|nr:hypothetical protein MKX03_021814 [Papaver bracteatum]
MSSKSFPVGFGLLIFGILALNAYSDMASAQKCLPGQLSFTSAMTLSCNGSDMKCGAWCSLKGSPSYNFCNGGGFGVRSCFCCCGTKTQSPKPKPPVPSPPPPSPPPPPPPRSPLDLCDPSEISFSSPSPGCPMCPVCNCPGGVPPELSACVSNYCSCCCPSTLSSSTRTPGSLLFAIA